MNTTRYLIHTLGDQSLTALAFVTEMPNSNMARITILPVDLMRPQAAAPIISLSKNITEDVLISGTHEKMCAAILKKAGIPTHHQLIFQKIPEPMRLD
ncbi:hypothetical protein Ga0100231_013560 [Opitutaceae bacterium TAV4]|nr:hypothetical protein Ga0100231_013560 [Opitutaceae bacterium TAV4]RRJ99439.1 hypothetical protein Ga0100230_014905 [Opitutaceae bacterium TAV3]